MVKSASAEDQCAQALLVYWSPFIAKPIELAYRTFERWRIQEPQRLDSEEICSSFGLEALRPCQASSSSLSILVVVSSRSADATHLTTIIKPGLVVGIKIAPTQLSQSDYLATFWSSPVIELSVIIVLFDLLTYILLPALSFARRLTAPLFLRQPHRTIAAYLASFQRTQR